MEAIKLGARLLDLSTDTSKTMSQIENSELKTPEQLDEEELGAVEGEIREVMNLMTERHNRSKADEDLRVARARRDRFLGDKQSVFHIRDNKHITTTMHTKTALDLADQLKLRIQLEKHDPELDDALERLSSRYVAVLERILGRSQSSKQGV